MGCCISWWVIADSRCAEIVLPAGNRLPRIMIVPRRVGSKANTSLSRFAPSRPTPMPLLET